MGQFGQNPNTSEIIDGLKGELEVLEESEYRIPILYALLRLLEKRPGRREEAFACLDEASDLAPELSDLAFEAWRAAYNRPVDKKLAALNELLPLLSDETDIMHGRLLRAQLLHEHGETTAASNELDAVEYLDPDRREVLWARVFTEGIETNASLAAGLEQVAMLTEDPIFEAALLMECACIKHHLNVDQDEMDRLLSLVLAIPELDWTLLDAVYRIAIQADLPMTGAAALKRMAEGALDTEDSTDHFDVSLGRQFKGLAHGPGVAASFEWLRGKLFQKYVGDIAAANEAIQIARGHLPDNRHLILEEALILESLGNAKDALVRFKKTEVPAERKALVALLAGQAEEALSIGLAARERPAGLFAEVISESVSQHPPPPSRAASPMVRLSWLESNPHHPEASDIAALLFEEGIDSPFVHLFMEERETTADTIVSVAESARDTAWSHALTAFLGPTTTRGTALLQLAEDTTDPILEAIFIRCAMLALPKNIPELSPLNAHLEQLEKNIDPDVHFAPTHENFEAAIRAIADAPLPSNPTIDDLVGRYKKALMLIFAVSSPEDALPLLSKLKQQHPSDPATALLGLTAGARAGEWREVTSAIETIRRLAPDDASLFDMLLGELSLIGTKDFATALACFDRCISEQENLKEMAVIYRLLTLHQMGAKDEIETLLTPQETAATKGEGVFADLFDDVFEDARQQSAIRSLEGSKRDTREQLGLRLAFLRLTLDGQMTQHAIESLLTELSQKADTSNSKQIVNAALALLKTVPFQPHGDDEGYDEELIWYSGHGLEETESYLTSKTNHAIPYDDLEWIDWRLTSAEIEADAGHFENALDILHEAKKRDPDHPGLNESQASFALMAESFTEAVDAHGRLVQIYDSPEEKSHHLGQAALILFDKLGMQHSARNICKSALRRFAEHAQGNEVIAFVLDATADLPPLSIPKPSRVSVPPEPKTTAEVQISQSEQEISELMTQGETEDALRLVNQLLLSAPKRVPLHRYKLDLLTHEKRWEEALIAVNLYLEVATQTEEQRSVVIRAATIAKDLTNDPEGALHWLKRLRENAAPFLEAEKRIFELAKQMDRVTEMEAVVDAVTSIVESEPDNADAVSFLKRITTEGSTP